MKDDLAPLRTGVALTLRAQLAIIIRLSVPAMLAQVSSIVMQYIDAAMVGRLGTGASAAIGLVSTTTWLIGGVMNACAIGFYVQVAHRIGAGETAKARSLVRHGLLTVLGLSLVFMSAGLAIRGWLPGWLGGDPAIRSDATDYFTVYVLTVPLLGLNYAAAGMLQCSGNIRLPSALNILKCLLDVLFNFLLIFPSRSLLFAGRVWQLPGCGLGVRGAALGTAAAEAVSTALMLGCLLLRSETLWLRREPAAGVYREELRRAVRIAVPVGLESAAMGLAYVASTRIVAPLGTVSMAAHSFSITAESLCYMPGYGIGVAATTIIGQVMGAGQNKTAKKLSWITVLFGMAVMTGAGAVMYLLAPQMLSLLSRDAAVRALGTQVLRIEAFAEPLYAASIVVSGVFRGLGDTLAPSLLNLMSMWAFRIPLSAVLARRFGLRGVWIAMAAELMLRGAVFLLRLIRKTYRKELVLYDRARSSDSD